MRLGMVIELDKCVGCQACVSSCKARWASGPGAARDWVMSFDDGERGEDLSVTFYPGLCNQCTDHPCTEACPTGATYANQHGVVMVDADVCIGCGNCMSACPYGARHIDTVKGIVEKCNFCMPYVERGDGPACVATCLAGCRHFGDLDDPESAAAQKLVARGAAPLTTSEVDIGPNVFYAPRALRDRVLRQPDVVTPVDATRFTTVWQGVTRPLTALVVPPVALVTGLAGLAINLRNRATNKQELEDVGRDSLPRHGVGMRVLHWLNLLTWILLLFTGVALISSPAFALFGISFPEWAAAHLGGRAGLLRLHVVWGLLWTALTVPVFLLLKRWGLTALREIAPTGDDVQWMLRKPVVMLGLTRRPLPPQDKYNAGQKAFATVAVLGTALIMLTGVVMTFHLGSPGFIRTAILAHKITVAMMLIGVAVHVTMAAIISEERPALFSMFTGRVDRHHAIEHCAKWVERHHPNQPASHGIPAEEP